ncbi:MAG: hypothetical protein ACYS8W_16975 [Planctomycetota bacterium]|jgi:hypothetical protein
MDEGKDSYWCEKNGERLELPCCSEPKEKCKHRSECAVYFEMEENKGKGCTGKEKGPELSTPRE